MLSFNPLSGVSEDVCGKISDIFIFYLLFQLIIRKAVTFRINILVKKAVMTCTPGFLILSTVILSLRNPHKPVVLSCSGVPWFGWFAKVLVFRLFHNAIHADLTIWTAHCLHCIGWFFKRFKCPEYGMSFGWLFVRILSWFKSIYNCRWDYNFPVKPHWGYSCSSGQ